MNFSHSAPFHIKGTVCLRYFLDGCYIQPEEISFKENVYNFSVDYKAIDKSDIIYIHRYLITKNCIQKCLGLLNKRLLYYQLP